MRKKIIKQCLHLARAKNNPESHPEYNNFHHFSFIVQNNKILEMGFNRKGPPLEGFGYSKEFGKIHSENDVYRKTKGIIDHSKPFDIVNIRLNKRGQLRLSKPCSCCANFLRVVGCRHVYFSTNDGFAKVI
jgi:hypothetical protein